MASIFNVYELTPHNNKAIFGYIIFKLSKHVSVWFTTVAKWPNCNGPYCKISHFLSFLQLVLIIYLKRYPFLVPSELTCLVVACSNLVRCLSIVLINEKYARHILKNEMSDYLEILASISGDFCMLVW